ncbi:amidase signature enzyme, partial [Thozetella sp. PMI_491]
LCNGINIEDATVQTLQRWMTMGNLSSQDLVTCYIARRPRSLVQTYLNSVSEINPDALSIAAALDDERAQGNMRGPMHGIPFLVKDNYYTDDKHNTSEGGLVLLGGRYSSEATVVTKVRLAGGVLLGHAAMSEAADHRASTNYSGGYSTRVGQTRNPFNLTQPTRGSSGGSVVAVRSNQVAIALGTETHGSLTHPAADLGLYTIKSTPGLMSRHGIVTGSFFHDTPGPLARSMADVALMLDIMAGADPLDNLTFEALGHYPEKGYSAEVVGKDALKGMKLGVPWHPYWATEGAMNAPGLRENYERRLRELRAAGAEIYNVTVSQTLAVATDRQLQHQIAYNTLLAVGYSEWLQNWTFPESDPRHGMSTLAEMTEWNDAHNASTGSLGNGTWWYNTISGQDFYDAGVATGGAMNGTFWTAFGWGRHTARAAIDGGHAYVTENGTVILLDGLLVPNGDAGGRNDPCASIPSYAGYPVAAVPIGQSGYGVPYGICVYGRRFGEAKLVRVASAMEDLFRWNATPLFWNYETAHGRWDAPWPGYTCTTESLERYACDAA